MEKKRNLEVKVYRIIMVCIVVGVVGFLAYYNFIPNVSEEQYQSTIPEELVGKEFNWRYNIGWDFHIEMDEEGLHWEGLAGDFEGRKESVQPQYTKIGDNMYFITWNVSNFIYDSIVLDFENDKVYAHSRANKNFVAIEGEIYVNGLE